MIRAVAIAAVLAASVTVVHAEDITISSADQCDETAMALDDLMEQSQASESDLAVAKDAVDKLKSACASGDFQSASNAATVAHGILVLE